MTESGSWAVQAALGDPRERAACATLLEPLVRTGTTTRAELARLTAWAPSTVSRRVAMLLKAGLLTERGRGASRGGRPATDLALDPGTGLLLCAQVGPERFTVSCSDFAGELLAKAETHKPIRGPERALADVAATCDRQVAELGRDATAVVGVALSLPCPVDAATGHVVRPPRMPGWDRFDFHRFFAQHFDAPLLVENDANLKALGEMRARRAFDQHLLYVEIGSGIGSGVVTRGVLHRGADGSAGEIGHLSLPGDDSLECQCGKSGCVEARAAGWALVRDLRAEGLDVATTRDVVRLGADGDPRVRRCVLRAAEHVGDVIAAAVSFYNPTLVAIGGELAELHEELLAGIRSVVYRRAFPLATRSVAIETSAAGDAAGDIGAVALLQEHLLSAAGLAQLSPPLLARRGPIRGPN